MIFVVLFIALSQNCKAQSRGGPLYYFNRWANLDTCIHKWPLDFQEHRAGRFTLSVKDSTVAKIINDTLYIYKRGANQLIVTNHIPFNQIDEKASMNIGPPPPLVVKIVKRSNSGCEGEVFRLGLNRDSVISSATYQWRVNGVPVGDSDTSLAITTLKVDDVVTCTATNVGACQNTTWTDTIVIQSLKPSITPTVSIAPSEFPICTDKKISFRATVLPAGTEVNYQWRVNNVIVGDNNPVLSPAFYKDGDNVSCTVGSLAKCVLPVKSDPFYIKSFEPPKLALKDNYTVSIGESVQFVPAITGNIASYTWLPADGLSSATVANPIASPHRTTKYTLTITNTDGCKASAGVTVKVIINIVNTFTPNGDGINDKWEISGLLYYPDCVINVFDRQGGLVYHSIGYPTSWDGRYNGKALPSGTYYYKIITKDETLAGNIAILR